MITPSIDNASEVRRYPRYVRSRAGKIESEKESEPNSYSGSIKFYFPQTVLVSIEKWFVFILRTTSRHDVKLEIFFFTYHKHQSQPLEKLENQIPIPKWSRHFSCETVAITWRLQKLSIVILKDGIW